MLEHLIQGRARLLANVVIMPVVVKFPLILIGFIDNFSGA